MTLTLIFIFFHLLSRSLFGDGCPDFCRAPGTLGDTFSGNITGCRFQFVSSG